MGAREESGYVFRDRYPEREAVYRCFDEKSADARRDLECLLDVPYGSGERESFDLYLGAAGGPLIVFVHGGYWQSLSKDRYGFVASFLVKRGFNVALPNYPLVPEVPLDRVVDSVRRSVPAILGEMSRAGRTPPFWIASGHSAGGHLAAVLATTDWRSRGIGLPLAACVPISGLFDLEPLIGTSLNDKLRLDLETAVALSPMKSGRHGGRLLAFVGTDETPAFVTQSEDYARHWQALGGVAELVRLRQLNHYTILCDLMEERSEIGERIVALAHGFRGEGKAGDQS